MTLNNKVYDALKFIAMILLPAIGTLYFALAGIWGLPYAEQVVGTITAIDTFLGAILGISSSGFKGDGEITINGDIISGLKLNDTAQDISKKKTITISVSNVDEDLKDIIEREE